MKEKRSWLEGLKDFVVGLRVTILFLISVAVGAGLLLVCGIGFAIATPIFIAVLTIALCVAVGILALIVSYFIIKRIGRILRERKKK